MISKRFKEAQQAFSQADGQTLALAHDLECSIYVAEEEHGLLLRSIRG